MACNLRAGFAAVVAGLVAPIGLHAQAGTSGCALIENGSFDDDLDGWTVDEQQSIRGDGEIILDTRVDDASQWFPWLDDHVLGVEAAVVASGKERAGFGESFIDVRVSRPIVVTGSTLQFIIGGGGEATWWGTPEITYLIALEVTDPEGEVHSIDLLQHTFNTPQGFCDIAISLAGFYNHPFNPELTEIDLLDATGVEIGDEITLAIRYRVDTIAPTPCDGATYFATFLVDNFTFCDIPTPGDLDGDGDVDSDDLNLLLADFGCVGTCAGDINGDGVTNSQDLNAVLAAFGQGVGG